MVEEQGWLGSRGEGISEELKYCVTKRDRQGVVFLVDGRNRESPDTEDSISKTDKGGRDDKVSGTTGIRREIWRKRRRLTYWHAMRSERIFVGCGEGWKVIVICYGDGRMLAVKYGWVSGPCLLLRYVNLILGKRVGFLRLDVCYCF